jgi:hypothetical protein
MMNDPNRPDDPTYYQQGYEHQQWDIAYEQWGAGALLAHALKYLMRCGKKPTSSMLRDVRNAINYLRHLEEKLVAEENKKLDGVSER